MFELLMYFSPSFVLVAFFGALIVYDSYQRNPDAPQHASSADIAPPQPGLTLFKPTTPAMTEQGKLALEMAPLSKTMRKIAT